MCAIVLFYLHSGAYPGGRTSGGPSESLILAPWIKIEEWCPYPPPPGQFGAPEALLAFEWQGTGLRIWKKEGGHPNLRTNRLWHLWGQGVFEGDVPPQKWRKKIKFKSQFLRFGAFLFAWGAHTTSGALSLQIMGGGCSAPEWLLNLFPFFLFLFPLFFPFFFSFLVPL